MPALTVRPSDGGKLITRAAAADAGVPHYTKKSNWRRDLTDEIIREGHDYFFPLGLSGDYLLHPFPGTTDPLTLIHLVRRPNGDSAVIVGTKTTLYRFRFDLSGYYYDPANPVYGDGLPDGPGGAQQPYFEVPTRWQIIGSGYSPSGRRWEWSDIDGTTTMNNGIDLPVAFRVEWDRVEPLYELREQGIVCVGTIGDTDGILLCGDITELQPDDIDRVLGVKDSGAITITQVGFKPGLGTSDGTTLTCTTSIFDPGDVGRVIIWSTGVHQRISSYISPTQVQLDTSHPSPGTNPVYASDKNFRVTDEITDGWPGSVSSSWTAYGLTASAPFFTGSMVGKTITWENGVARRIVAVYTTTLARTDDDRPVAAGKVLYENPLAYVGKDQLSAPTPTGGGIQNYDRRQYRVIYSELNQPTRFAVLIQAVFNIGTNLLRLPRASRSLGLLENVAINRAGLNGGVLTDSLIVSIGPGRMTIDKNALSTGDGTVQRSSSIGSIVGASDLQDDGSGILKMKPLAGRIIVYKDTNIFIGRYTGVVDKPFNFERIVVPHGRSLYFRNTVSSLQDVSHVYAGKDRFYRFDLTARQPQPIADGDLVSNLFFDHARISDTESIYSEDNHPSQEVWTICPNAPTLCYDYLYNTFSTTDFRPTACATVKSASYPLVAETGEWFLLGTSNGVLLIYGLVTEPLPGWPVGGGQPWQDGKRIYYRRSANPYSETKQAYDAVLSGGRMHFGSMHNEKEIERYILGLSSQPQVEGVSLPVLAVSFFTSINQNAAESLLGTASVPDADLHGLIPLHCICHYLRDEISVSVDSNPVRLHNRTFEVRVITSKSHHRK